MLKLRKLYRKKKLVELAFQIFFFVFFFRSQKPIQKKKYKKKNITKLKKKKNEIDKRDPLMAEFEIHVIDCQRITAQEYERQRVAELKAQQRKEKEISAKHKKDTSKKQKEKAAAITKSQPKNKAPKKSTLGSKQKLPQKNATKIENKEQKNEKRGGLSSCFYGFFAFFCSVFFY